MDPPPPPPDHYSSDTAPLRHRQRRHHSTICLSSCFFPSATEYSDPGAGKNLPSHSSWSQLPSPSSWFKPRSHHPEFKGKCRNLVSRVRGHRRHHSADFTYDPVSYALNFDEGNEGDAAEDDLRFRAFSSRVPASPPPLPR